MADDESVQQVAEDTGLSDATEPSTNEETQDTDVDLEDITLSEDEVKAFEQDEETEESEESTEDEAATESETEKSEESAEDEEPKEEDTASEDDKRRLAAQQAFKEREARRMAEKQKAQSEYLDGAEDEKDLALRQLQIDAYNNRVESNNNKLQSGIDRALASIDLFKDGTSEAKEELIASLDDFERMYVKRDQNGDPVAVEADVYEYLTKRAESIRRLMGAGAVRQEKSKAKVKAKTFTPPAKTPKTNTDKALDAFDAEFDKWS